MSRVLLPRLLAAAALTVLTGCTSLKLSLNGLGGYQEFSHDGRTYVLSRADTIANFKTTHEVQLSKTIIGGGAKGETLVVETDAKEPFLADKLLSMYREAHGLKK